MVIRYKTFCMRQRFEQQLSLRTVAIPDIKIPLKSRDELPAVVKALQHIFITPELNEKVFSLLENKIGKGKKKTGRRGMDLWHILVLAVVRHSVDTNWDRLEMMANYDIFVRQIMGVHCTGFLSGEEKIEFSYQTILDNVSLVDEVLLAEVNQLVVEAGHQLLKKKEGEEAFRLKTDSYVLETNIHFPTDLNLLWDSSRKCLNVVECLLKHTRLTGWRKIKHMYRTLKSQFRKTSHQVFKGKNEVQKKQYVKEYLKQATELLKRCEELIQHPPVATGAELKIVILMLELGRYCKFLKKFTDQIERRLIEEETIPAEEKIFSIFEEHTEWITKGKLNKKVELGHLILITTDQHDFIVDYKIMEGEKDASQISDLNERLKTKFENKTIFSHSFDKGFYSKANLEVLQHSGIEHVILPKKGRLNKEDKQRESDKKFKELRHAHSAVESNINMLEHHGLNRCMDKGLYGYKRCVGLSVLAYNLHQLGNVLLAKERKEAEKKQGQAARAA
jgi:transposase, IS5 family